MCLCGPAMTKEEVLLKASPQMFLPFGYGYGYGMSRPGKAISYIITIHK